MLGLSTGLLAELLGGSASGTLELQGRSASPHPTNPHALSPWGDHIQEVLQSLPEIFLAPRWGACRNPGQRTQAAWEEDPEVYRGS